MPVYLRVSRIPAQSQIFLQKWFRLGRVSFGLVVVTRNSSTSFAFLVVAMVRPVSLDEYLRRYPRTCATIIAYH